MKTFTTYAEKKAKQFFNLLQGYTKGIRMTAILILLLMGVGNAWGETVLFLKNTIPFNNGRYAYFYTSSYWDGNNGAGSNNIASQCNSMTKLGWDGQSDIYVYQTSSNYKYVAIMDHSQKNYGNFWETQGCAATYDDCDGLYDITKPMMIPTSTDPFTKNQTTQYYHFSWNVPTIWIKHPFGGGSWSYKQMTYNNDGTFSVDAEYSNGNGCNYGCSSGNDHGWIASPTKTPSGTWSHLARFKMTFSGGSVKISITKLCKVTFNMNGHGSAIDAQNVLYKSKATQPSNPTASGYTFGGWYTDKNCTSAFDFNTEITDDKTLYAKWTATETLYTVEIKSAGNGTVDQTSVQAGSTTKPTITATPTTGYEFDRWEKEGGATVANATSATTTVSATAAGTITAYFKETMHTINVKSNNDTYGTVTPASVTAGIATGSTNITATPETGYSFANWTADNGITIADVNSATTKVSTATTTGTVTANFQEKKHDVTVSYKCGTTTIKDNTTTSNVGEVTSTTITAPDIYGYTFKSWELGSGINQKSVNGKSITITTKATGNYTLTAKYDEDLSTEWSLAHSIDGFNTSSHKFTKNTGESAGNVAYVSIDLASNANYQFKVVNGSTWYGNNNNNNGETYWIKNTVENWEFYSDAGNCHMKSSVAGTYTFKIDFSGNNPKVSVYFPTSYTVTYSRVPANAADEPTTNPSVASGGKVLSGTSIKFSAKDAKDGYTWKGWYSNNAGNGNALTANKDYTTAITANTTIYAVYTANTYTVELNQEGATTVGTASVKATYGAAMPNIDVPARTGYTFLGYWTEKEGKGTQYYNTNGTSANNWDQASDDILYAHWEEAQYTVTFGVHSTGHGQILFENTSTVINGSGKGTSQQKHGASISFTATPFAGYEVEGWYSDADCTQRIEAAGTHTRYNPAPVTSDVTIYVKFKEETRRIYLKPAGDNGWADGNARFAMYVIDDQTWYSMTKINDGDDDTGNDIYYCDIKPTYQNVIFCRMNPGNNTNNWDDANRWTQTKDLQILEDCNLFDVAADASTENQYLADGQWMEYNAWQLVGSFSSWDPCGNRFDENSDGTYTYTIELTAGDYEFKLVRNGIWYGNNGDMERNGTGVQSGGWDMYHDAGDCTLKADMTGNYIFTIHKNGKLTVTYPVTGYQLKITMNSGKVYTSNSVGNAGDILSFFAPGKNETGNNAGVVELCFEGKLIQPISSATFETSNVYVAKLNANKNGITDVALYDGNYYIRTDGAAGGWNNYKQNSNKMTYFVPRADEKYSYYWVESVRHSNENNRVNVKACVSNQYNNDLAGMLENDKFTDINGDVYIQDPTVNGHVNIERVNLRFGYNPKTNHFERAMLTGSGNINSFLNITDPDGKIYKTYKDGKFDTPLTARDKDSKFTDISNWVYERDVWVDIPQNEDVTVQLTARAYNGADNSLFGFEDEEYKVPTERIIVGAGSSPGPKKMRVIYDFKTNRMIMAWMPGAYTCNTEEILHADVLFMRHENKIVPQLIVEEATNQATPQIKGIKSQFFALEFDKYEKEKLMEEQYWFTLPFDCVVGSISGVPGYMQTWGIQRYDGELRAANGWFDPETTFWDWLGPNDVMEAGVGYVLSFDKNAATWSDFDVHDDNGNLTETISVLRLYFPSTEEGFTFESTTALAKTYDPIPCEIQTANRHLQDGHWRIIGPLSYNSASASPENATDDVWKPVKDSTHIDVPDDENYTWDKPMFLYEFWQDDSNRSNWKYIVKSANNHTYQAFYGYMVQFAGTITWSEITQSTHSALRARTYTDQVPTNITTNLDLVDAEGVQHDQTFVALDVEGTTTYDLNKDLNKVFNNNFANIYTLSEGIPFAGNTLPMEKAIVPVGVRIATAGEYTFRMPDGTDGISVTLVDNVTGTHTDMLMDEYTITLDAGTIENRFYLVVDPDRTATSVENVGEEAKGEEAKDQIKKFLIDGKLFIRTADGIFDAKGQRL